MLKAEIDSVELVKENSYRQILSGIDFEIKPDKVYTILGKNGSGKSTLIKALTALLDKAQYKVKGKVIFENVNLLNTTPDVLQQIRKNKIRYVFQDAVGSFDPLKKFSYYFKLSGADKNNLNKLMQFFLLPGYEKVSSLYPYEVSGGMAQRLSLVLALTADPQLLILDEPTSGVDYAVINLLVIRIKDFKKENKSVIIVTQDIKFAETVSDYIGYLSNGSMDFFLSKDDFFNININPELDSLLKSYNEIEK